MPLLPHPRRKRGELSFVVEGSGGLTPSASLLVSLEAVFVASAAEVDGSRRTNSSSSSLSLSPSSSSPPFPPLPAATSPAATATIARVSSKQEHEHDQAPSDSRRLIRPSSPSQDLKYISAGLLSGLIVAGAFNPWDRALYLSIRDGVPFLRLQNWKSPYRGFTQTIFQRVVSGGVYFPLVDIFSARIRDRLSTPLDPVILHSLAGMAAGATNGLCFNFLSAIKYQSWGPDDRNFSATVKNMYQKGGFRPFIVGTMATMSRDFMFGGIFSTVKAANASYWKDVKKKTPTQELVSFGVTIVGGLMATVASSPLNYCRNVQYATPPHARTQSSVSILRELLRDTRQHSRPLHHLKTTLQVGWGSARVAVGMTVGAILYDSLVDLIS